MSGIATDTGDGFRLPGMTDRLAIVGQTGSGKTRFGVWALSRMPFDKMPYIIVDYKRDDLIDGIDRAKEIDFGDVPKHPGLYVIRPNPGDDDDAIEQWMLRIWERGNTGLYIDEGYMLPQKPKGAFTYILTQGRSKHIPVIALSQRPAWVSRFIFSEAGFFAVFRLQHTDDYQTVQKYIPKDKVDIMAELPDFHSTYYDAVKRVAFRLKPVPDDNAILSVFEDRLNPKRRSL